MDSTIIVSKGEKAQTINTVYLQNNNIILTKNTKGEEYEIELHRFSKEEIEQLQKSIEYLYEQLSNKRKSSIKNFILRLIK